jgi:hypothetical protein
MTNMYLTTLERDWEISALILTRFFLKAVGGRIGGKGRASRRYLMSAALGFIFV